LKQDNQLFAAWVNTIFDRSSEGIEEHLLRATKPAALFEFAPALVSYAITAMHTRMLDHDSSRGGLSYFQGTLLNWTLVPVINGLVAEIMRLGFLAPLHFEALRCLLPSGDLGLLRPVIRCCGPNLQRLLTDSRREPMKARFKFDDSRIQDAFGTLFPLRQAGVNKPQWAELPRKAIRRALSITIEGGSTCLDVIAGLLALGPVKYLDLLWTELSAMAALGEIIIPREVGIFVLTALLPPPHPPLLPLFLSHTVPLYFGVHCHQRAPDINSITLLANLVATSLLTLLHYERAGVTATDAYRVSDLASTFLERIGKLGTGSGDLLYRQIMLHSHFSLQFIVNTS